MKIWKRNAIVITVLLFVCVAIYLNWSYGVKAAADEEAEAGKLLGDVSLISAEGEAAAAEGETGITPLSEETQEYFASARLSRQEGRDSAVEILQEAAVFGETDGESVSYEETNAQIQLLADYALTEAQIETLVIAKGYADCVAMVDGDGVTILVASPAEGLSTEDVAKLTDIAVSGSGCTYDQLKIIEIG